MSLHTRHPFGSTETEVLALCLGIGSVRKELLLPQIFLRARARPRVRSCGRGIRHAIRRRYGACGARQYDFPITI